jgi:hypothetical protein
MTLGLNPLSLVVFSHLDWCFACVVCNHEIHCNVFTVHVSVYPRTNMIGHHIGEEMTEILKRIIVFRDR